MTKELLVQTYLHSGKDLNQLKLEHGINYRITNGKISLSYNQIEAKESDILAQQCRGLILYEGTYDICALPFFRFFNFGQGTAAKIDWESAKYQEKLDGSLLIVYFDKNQTKWMCATRQMPEAEGIVQDTGFAFSQLVEKAINKLSFINLNEFMIATTLISSNIEFEYSNLDWKDLTFCFELCSPYNRVVCLYDDIKLFLLGVRNNKTHEELNTKYFADCLLIDRPKEYIFNDVQDTIKAIQSWKPLEQEGIVVVDKFFNKIKIKNPSYVAYNHMRDSLSTSWRGCVEIVLLGQEDDIIPMMSEHIANRLIKIKKLVRDIIIQINYDYDQIKHIDEMKTFALEANKSLWSAPLFALKRKKVKNINEFIIGTNGISVSIIDQILFLCEKIDPTFKNII